MQWKKLVVTVLASGLFFPVSCSIGVGVGTRIVARMDSREAAKGDKLHPLASVVAEPGKNGDPFRILSMQEVPHVEAKRAAGEPGSREEKRDGPLSYIMTKSSASLDSGGSSYSYDILEQDGPGQIIEVVQRKHDGDNTVWSRYRSTVSGITPISSRMFYMGYMFGALPYAFGFALILYFLGRYWKRRL